MNSSSDDARAISRRWSVAAGIVLLLIITYWLRLALLPFVIAGALAYVVTPAVDWVRRRWHWPRWLAALGIFLAMMALLALAAFWIQRVIVPQVISLSHTFPILLRTLFEKIFHSNQIDVLGHHFDADAVAAAIIDSIGNFIGGPAQAVFGLLAGVMMFFLTLFLLAFFLISGPRWLRGALWLVPPWLRPHVRQVARRAHPILYRYVGGVILIVILTTILCYIGTGLFLHLPDAILLSMAVGVLEAIPVIGPITSASLLAVVAVGQGKMSILIGVAIFAFALRLFIDQLAGPIIIGGAVRLHPAVVIFVFLAGGTLFGVLGVIMAVPVAAVVKVALAIYYDETSTTLHAGSDSRNNLP